MKLANYGLLKLLLSQPEIASSITDANGKDFIEKEIKRCKRLLKTQSSLDIYTPRGTYVANTVRSDGADDPWDPWVFEIEEADDFVRETYPQATIISSSTRTYNCHSYAWANGYTNRCWINTPSDDLYIEEPDGDGSYDYIAESVATKVSYSGDHSATTTATPNVYISKWGSLALVQHNKNYVPGSYNSPSLFHRRSVDVPEDFSSIDAALNNSAEGQDMIISTGNYTVSSDLSAPANFQITISGNVIINGQNAGFKFTPGSSTIIVNGSLSVTGSEGNLFKFISNSATPSRSDWGGIYVDNGGSINLNYCEIADAVAGIQTESVNEFSVQNSFIHHTNYHGILVDIPWSKTANILNNCIYDNIRSGIMVIPSNGNVNIKYNLIYKNYDHGMFVQPYRADIQNNTVTNNCNGIWVCGSSSSASEIVKNNIVVENNLSGYNNGHHGIWVGSTSYPAPLISYNDVWNNSGGNYYNCSAGTGDISQDPLFLDKNNYDYRLYCNSPCIDAGDPNSANDPDGTRTDIGAMYYPQMSVSGAITADTTWYGNYHITGDVTVNDGVELTIDPGTVVRFDESKEITVYGTLTAEGTVDDHIIFTRSDPNSSDWTYWDKLCLKTGSSFSFDYIEMYGASYGIQLDYTSGLIQRSFFEENGIPIYLYHSDNVHIEDCQFSNSNYGIACLYSDEAAIYNNIINNCYNYGIYLYNSSAYIKGTTIENTTEYDGIMLSSYSDIDMNKVIAYPNAELNNRIADNERYGVNITSTASADLGCLLYMQPPYLRGGFNQFDHGIGAYDVKNYSSSTIRAEVNWWEDMTNSGLVDTYPTAEDQGYQLSKSVGDGEYEEIQQLLTKAYHLENVDSTYAEAINVLNQAVAIAPDDSICYYILLGLARNYNKLDDEGGLLDNLDRLYSEYGNHLIGKIALDYSVKVCASERNFSEALRRSERIISIWSADANAREALAWALFNQAMIYMDMDTTAVLSKSSVEITHDNFKKILTDYSETEAAWATAEFLGVEKPLEDVDVIPAAFKLSQNYPNPFNPVTTIKFDLPQTVPVKLQVFDLTGRLVQTLVDENKPAGHYTVVWDAQNVISGIYLIRLNAGDFTAVKKYVKLK